MAKIINGIQQIGIGVADAKLVFDWYRKRLGFDILVFEDVASASLMTRYTGNVVRDRYALLALNMTGGGGLEIWQFKDRQPEPPERPMQIGDLGINVMKIRSSEIDIVRENLIDNARGLYPSDSNAHENIKLKELDNECQNFEKCKNGKAVRNVKVHDRLETQEVGGHKKNERTVANQPTQISIKAAERSELPHFFISDPWNNWVQVVKEDYNFTSTKNASGGVLGAIIGVSNMEASLKFYRRLLGYDVVISDRSGCFKDFSQFPGGSGRFRRLILTHADRPVGGFGKLYGPSQIELIQSLDRPPISIFENRMWGDLGYIHLCFDVLGMDILKKEADESGYAFTVDSADSFDMGDAAGRFGYLEDPDGTLIELVETHKVPIFKPLGLSINLKSRAPDNPLPRWLVKFLRVHRVKD